MDMKQQLELQRKYDNGDFRKPKPAVGVEQKPKAVKKSKPKAKK